MNIIRLLKNKRQTLAVLGMTPKEFELLLVTFSNIYMLEKKNRERKRKLGGGRKGFIKDIRNKLFVTLFYLKVYPNSLLFISWDINDIKKLQRRREKERRNIDDLIPLMSK